tara:strand:+ start:516 stop:704 length:189 start_codon:yes stop_codon:yes gene_type:complete
MKRTIKMIADFRERIEQQEEKIEQLDNENRLLKREIKFSEEKLTNAYKRIKDLVFKEYLRSK